jgi:hypothetical protein
MKEQNHVLVYDLELKAPACVLLQAAFGCDAYATALRHFNVRHWLTSPTPGMRKVRGTDDEWKRVAQITAAAWGERNPSAQGNSGELNRTSR